MTRADVVDIIAARTGLSKSETDEVIRGFLDTVSEALVRGESVELRGFGTFKVVERAPRTARKPRTNETVSLPARSVPVLKFSKDLRTRVSDPG